jgi:hypothetical protein
MQLLSPAYHNAPGHVTSNLSDVSVITQVGVKAFTQSTDLPYSDTSVEGYSGIMVKSYSGDVDCIQFINATGGVTQMIGAPVVPGNWTVLRCLEESKIVGKGFSSRTRLGTPASWPTTTSDSRLILNAIQLLKVRCTASPRLHRHSCHLRNCEVPLAQDNKANRVSLLVPCAGIFGWDSGYVASIGIICSPGVCTVSIELCQKPTQ